MGWGWVDIAQERKDGCVWRQDDGELLKVGERKLKAGGSHGGKQIREPEDE